MEKLERESENVKSTKSTSKIGEKIARALRIASQPSQPEKATIHILKSDKNCLGENSERLKNVKSTFSTTKSAHTYSKTSLS